MIISRAKAWLLLGCLLGCCRLMYGQSGDYLQAIKAEMKKEWPHNRTINLVFHGHSVPSGYFRTPYVNTLGAYPYLTLKALKALYPNAVINVIVTAIGGENSVQGAKRFRKTVLNHRPDVLFIDYALNDRRLGLEASRKAMEKMIREAQKKHIKVILLTPSADTQVNLLQPGNVLEQFSTQIIEMAGRYGTGLVNSYALFRDHWGEINTLMAQNNHPNEKGHQLIADEIVKLFK